MITLGISHIGMGVSDLDRSVHFYNKVLGLPIVHEMDYDEVPEILRHPERLARRAVYFRVGEAPREVVIVMGTIDRESTTRSLLLDELGIHHFAFWVDDIHALYRRLLEANVEVIFKPADVPVYHVDQEDSARGPGPATTMFFLDPDGIMLQADQRRPRQ